MIVAKKRGLNKLLNCVCFPLIISVVIISCSAPSGKLGRKPIERTLEEIPPGEVRYILIGKAVGMDSRERYQVIEAGIIEDSVKVQTIFSDIKRAEPVSGRDLFFMPPRPVIFLNQAKVPICGFLYWDASRPKNMFKRFEVLVEEGHFVLGDPIFEPEMTYRKIDGRVTIQDVRVVDGVERVFSYYLQP